MRLIDADALRKQLLEWALPLDSEPGGYAMTQGVFDALDSAPTVCCERCRHLRPGAMEGPSCYLDVFFHCTPSTDGCSEFEERTDEA